MRIPFEKLVHLIEDVGDEDPTVTIGGLARRFDVSTERVMDAIDASKMLRGEITYISLDPH